MTGERGQSAFDKIGKQKRVIAERFFECKSCGSNLSPRITKGNFGLSVLCLLICVSAPVLCFLVTPKGWLETVPYMTVGLWAIFGSLFQWIRQRRRKECRACGELM